MAAGGTYTLVVALSTPARIEVGALGTISFDEGWYAYVGTALGPGGFSRIDRHRELATGTGTTRHWHVDYLLGHSESSIHSVIKTAAVDAECRVADHVDATAVPHFGCSDCDCHSHLFFDADRENLLNTARRAHENLE